MSVGDFSGRVKPAAAPDIVFNFLLFPSALFEFLGVGVVPAREADLCRRAVVGRIRARVLDWIPWRWREDRERDG